MTVTGCDDCPLKEGYWTEDVLEHLCAHPDAPENADTFVDAYMAGRPHRAAGQGAPDWCPLRKGPLTIALVGAADPMAALVDEVRAHCDANECGCGTLYSALRKVRP